MELKLNNLKVCYQPGELNKLRANQAALAIEAATGSHSIIEEENASSQVGVLSGQSLIDSIHTKALAVLPRGDLRNVLLINKSSINCSKQSLEIAYNAPISEENFAAFIEWALPNDNKVILRKVDAEVHQFLYNTKDFKFDGLLLPKVDLDLLIDSRVNLDTDRLKTVKLNLTSFIRIVIPLSVQPTEPGQGLIGLVAKTTDSKVVKLIDKLNHRPSFHTLQEESLIKSLKNEYSAISIIARPYGQIVYKLHTLSNKVTTQLRNEASELPRAQSSACIWPSSDEQEFVQRKELEIEQPDLNDQALFVARADALPKTWLIRNYTPVWVAGLKSWEKLTSRGVWVNGCLENLGEDELQHAKTIYPEISTWIKLTHTQGFADKEQATLATYAIDIQNEFSNLSNKTHFYWNSGSKFLTAIKQNPEILFAWHACGPGNTFKIISKTLPDPKKLTVYLSFADFYEAVRPVDLLTKNSLDKDSCYV